MTMRNKLKRIEKKIHKLNAKELRQIETTINQIYVKEIKKQLNNKRGETKE